jgi:ArsR family transcriptional regulator, lead/cadmium/zinc/bismuth-responsive transcriptional repressor
MMVPADAVMVVMAMIMLIVSFMIMRMLMRHGVAPAGGGRASCYYITYVNRDSPVGGYWSTRVALSITPTQVVELAETFRIMGEPSRLAIILSCLDGPVSVSDIAAATRLSANLVSHHLRLLRAARILRAERRGRQVFYAAADQHVRRTLAELTAAC